MPPIVDEVLGSAGSGLDVQTRTMFEHRFGHDFSRVRVHSDDRADRSARAVRARAYTVGADIAFASGQYAPHTPAGRRLLAHELAHVVQQSGSMRTGEISIGGPTDAGEMEAERAADSMSEMGGGLSSHRVGLQRQSLSQQPDPMDDVRMHPPGAPKAQTCGGPSSCPPTFCQPYDNESYATHMRTKMLPVLMAGIAIAVDSRVVPLWHEYLLGGSSAKNLSKQFAADFTASKTTKKTTDFMADELLKDLTARPPVVARSILGVPMEFQDLTPRIAGPIASINAAGGAHEMDFNYPGEVPGNIAGAIGTNQLACRSGARPSAQNDERLATARAFVSQDASARSIVTVTFHYTVKDTIDLCPGNCGTSAEQMATVPMSQFEATGISGDVPFTVEFDDVRTLTIPPKAVVPAPAKPPAKPTP